MPATKIAPSLHPLRFREVANIRYNYGPNWPSPPNWPSTAPDRWANPKGITYSEAQKALVVSVSPQGATYPDRFQILRLLKLDGSHDRFGTITMARGIESKVIAVPSSGPPVSTGGFTANDVFVPTGHPFGSAVNAIARSGSSGTTLSDPWFDPAAQNGNGQARAGLWGGLAFDLTGSMFNGELLVCAIVPPKIWRVTGAGASSVVKDLTGLGSPEGLAVAPAGFDAGTHRGKVFVGIEGNGSDSDTQSGDIYAIDNNGVATLIADIEFAAETLAFVPDLGGTFFLTELEFNTGERGNRVLMVPASQWLARRNRLIAINEIGGEIWEVFYDSVAADYKQRNIGRVPGPWTTPGFSEGNTEAEAGTFGVLPPTAPIWSSYYDTNPSFPNFRAKGPPAVASANNRLYFFAVSNGANGYALDKVHYCYYDFTTGWNGDWAVVGNTTVTSAYVGGAAQGPRVYVFATVASGIHQLLAFVEVTAGVPGTWTLVANSPSTPAATLTRPAAAYANGRIAVVAHWNEQNAIVLSELPSGGYLGGSRLHRLRDCSEQQP